MPIHSKRARETRDKILDLVVDGDIDRAVRAYRDATGAGADEAHRVISRLHAVLQAGDELSADDQRFLDELRADLHAGSRGNSFEQLDRPHASWSKQSAALALYVILALLTFNLLGGAILLVAGGLAASFNTWFGFIAGILLAGPMFIVFPGLLRGVVVRRLGIGHFVRSPGFGWEIALGFVLLIAGVLGTVLTERVLWAARARVVEVASPDELATVHIDRSAILHIRESRVPGRPAGTFVETRRDRQGSISRSEYVVRPLIGPRTDRPCWWVGRADSSFSGFQHPMLGLDDDSPFFVHSPTHAAEYEQAVADALGAPPPACTQVFERVPHPDEVRASLGRKLRRLAISANAAAWVLLGIWGAAWTYRRFKSSGESADR